MRAGKRILGDMVAQMHYSTVQCTEGELSAEGEMFDDHTIWVGNTDSLLRCTPHECWANVRGHDGEPIPV